MNSIAFKFAIGDKVIVKEIQRPGTVKALTVDYLGLQYSVHYWNDGHKKQEWLLEDEIELRVANK